MDVAVEAERVAIGEFAVSDIPSLFVRHAEIVVGAVKHIDGAFVLGLGGAFLIEVVDGGSVRGQGIELGTEGDVRAVGRHGELIDARVATDGRDRDGLADAGVVIASRTAASLSFS